MRPYQRNAALFILVFMVASNPAYAVKVMCVTTVDPAWKESVRKDQIAKDNAEFKEAQKTNPNAQYIPKHETEYTKNAEIDEKLIDKRSKKIHAQNKARKQSDVRCSNKVKSERESLKKLRKIVPKEALACMCVNGGDQNADDGMTPPPSQQGHARPAPPPPPPGTSYLPPEQTQPPPPVAKSFTEPGGNLDGNGKTITPTIQSQYCFAFPSAPQCRK